MGRHTIKAGFYNNHSFKAQNTGAGGIANLTFQGYVNFGNDTTTHSIRGFGFANAATGVFTQYLQASSSSKATWSTTTRSSTSRTTGR